jgi:hypothetical protein
MLSEDTMPYATAADGVKLYYEETGTGIPIVGLVDSDVLHDRLNAIRPYAVNPTRVQFQAKDPRGWREFADQFAVHSALGKALTLRGVLARRPPIPHLEQKLRNLRIPTPGHHGRRRRRLSRCWNLPQAHDTECPALGGSRNGSYGQPPRAGSVQTGSSSISSPPSTLADGGLGIHDHVGSPH